MVSGKRIEQIRPWSVRAATVEDIGLMVEYRRAMFIEMGARDPARVERMAEAFGPYVAAAMPRGDFYGWVAEADGEAVGGVAAVIQHNPPSMRSISGTVGYVMNLYVRPSWRRRGIARTLIDAAVESLREQGVGAVLLHASQAGRPLYEQMGFAPTTEMRLLFDEDGLDPYGSAEGAENTAC